MSESTSEDFSDSDSDVSQEQPIKKKEVVKRKVNAKDSSEDEIDSDSSDNEDGGEGEEAAEPAEPVKKRKRLQDYLNEKVNIINTYTHIT